MTDDKLASAVYDKGDYYDSYETKSASASITFPTG
jgi:hypothetical protein